MTAKHTPGPWELHRNCVFAPNDHGENRFYAHVQTGRTNNGERTSLEELTANASLISAAPDLLTTLEEIQFRLEAKNYHSTPDCLNNDEQCIVVACRAAIAKAKGEA